MWAGNLSKVTKCNREDCVDVCETNWDVIVNHCVAKVSPELSCPSALSLLLLSSEITVVCYLAFLSIFQCLTQ